MILQAVLAAVTIIVLAITALQLRRRNLLYAEPWSLAGLGTLVADWERLRTGFGSVSAGDSMKELKRKVSENGNRYVLMEGEYLGKPFLGIHALPGQAESLSDRTPQKDREQTNRHMERPLMLWTVTLTAYILFLIGIMTIILIYRFTTRSKIEKFMSSEGAGVKLFFMALVMTVRSGWEPIEREARHIEIFHTLSLRHQPSSVLLRDHVRAFPLISDISALLNGNIFIFLIGVIGLCIDSLIVSTSLSEVAFSSIQTWAMSNMAFCLSVPFLGATAITVFLAALLRRRRIGMKMPRVPYTIAAVISYLYAARMMEELTGLSTLSEKERNREVMGIQKGCGFRWTVGRDGRKRVGVDEEELAGTYKMWEMSSA
ncbi:hypothetical protein K440DRAFT_635242 [Wilcoxina mikolae CBS 423.85]|nr:hypothetical protein K440DRAFT_635242 [Wilcoxina mikolae CBS 423.85]